MFRKTAQPAKPTPASDGASVTETAPCQKSVRLRVPREEIAPVRSAVLAEFQRQAALPGFRKGKAPAEVVERQYAQDIQTETLHRVTKQAFERVAADHGLKPVGPFEVSQADFSETEGLTLEATVEVEPAFALGAYQGIALTREPLAVAPQELEQALASLRESMAQLVPAKEEGETKERQLPPVDDELAKDLGFETLEKLKAHVAAKVLEQKRTAQARALEAALCDALLARHAFEVPPRLVIRQTEQLTRDFKTRLLLSGISEEQAAQETEQFTRELRTSAERHVKLAFILDRIASQESVQVTQDELVKRLWQLSQRWKKDPVEVRKLFDAQGLWPSVVSSIRQEKTIAFLLSAAHIDDSKPEDQADKTA
ncbi:MAG: trigger factor [Candidatus Omnitrophica bacterium]|nr:trigger factor [Candidatus Omnitrophota bacterium]